MNKESRRVYTARWHANNPDRVRAMKYASGVVQRELKKGNITRPSACEECGKECKPDAAHADYGRVLDIRWLCKSCHNKWDRKTPKTCTGVRRFTT